MGEGLAHAITIASPALAVLSLSLTVGCTRERSRLIPGSHMTEALIGVGSTLVMAVVTSIPAGRIAAAEGPTLRFATMTSLEVVPRRSDRCSRRHRTGERWRDPGMVPMAPAGSSSESGIAPTGRGRPRGSW